MRIGGWSSDVCSSDLGLVGQDGAAVGDDALRADRPAVGLKAGADVVLPLLAPAGDLGVPGRKARRRLDPTAPDLRQQLAEEGSGVSQDAEVRRIVAANLLVVDVDVPQLRRREVP